MKQATAAPIVGEQLSHSLNVFAPEEACDRLKLASSRKGPAALRPGDEGKTGVTVEGDDEKSSAGFLLTVCI